MSSNAMLWRTAPLGEWPISFIDGDRSSKYPKRSELVAEGVPFLNSTNISNATLGKHGLDCITVEKAASIRKGKVQEGDIVMTTRGSIGKVAICPSWASGSVINAQMLLLRADGVDLEAKYLFHALRSQPFQDRIKGFASGSAQPQIPMRDLKQIEFSAPDILSQRRIVSILSAYDDLIENNTRRIEILEEMARRLYEEWFVQFRFPGHEEGVFENDMLPQGWVYAQLSEIASYISRGISPKYDEEASCRVINQKCIRNQRLDVQLSRRQNKKVPAEKLIQLGDVLINSTGVGTLGRVAQVHEVLEDVTVDSHVTIARAGDSVDVDYFGSTLLSLQHFFELQGVGSTGQTELSRSRIAEANVIVPPYELQAQFGKLIRPMRVLGTWLAKKNSNLRAQRDLLLPKLISGEIDVSDIPMPT
ncbi:restriction endonuclease subunit S [Pseudomonas putida]|uniref:restriction endonuclease subunit S n=1 Tax=Pseudomonas TaxID=286 RepID=UPI003466CBE3